MARVSLSQHSSYFKRGLQEEKKSSLRMDFPARRITPCPRSQAGLAAVMLSLLARGFTAEQAGQHLHQAFYAHTCINHSTELCAAAALQKFPALRARVGYSRNLGKGGNCKLLGCCAV